MTTVSFPTWVEKNQVYQFSIEKPEFLTVVKQKIRLNQIKPQTPKYVNVTPLKIIEPKYDTTDNNILGENGRMLFIPFKIPLAETTPEKLLFYGCRLLKKNDLISFSQTMPVSLMNIGKNYVKNYLMHNGGFYFEWHSAPHFHAAINSKASGTLILGKKCQNSFLISRFKIPFGYAIYTPEEVVHCDSSLIGDYLVAYTKASSWKTYSVVDSTGKNYLEI